MIERVYIKECLIFKEVDLNLEKNLIIFSGPSGAGKSVLMNAILSLFGFRESDASLIEASINKSLNLEEFGIEEDEINVFKLIQNKKKDTL